MVYNGDNMHTLKLVIKQDCFTKRLVGSKTNYSLSE